MATGDIGAIAARAGPSPEAPLAGLGEAIDDAFSAPDLAVLAARLQTSDWGMASLKRCGGIRQYPWPARWSSSARRARDPGLGKALQREYRFTWRAASDGDLLEGIRAAVIDKDRNPAWRDELDGVRPEEVAAMLAPLGEG